MQDALTQLQWMHDMGMDEIASSVPWDMTAEDAIAAKTLLAPKKELKSETTPIAAADPRPTSSQPALVTGMTEALKQAETIAEASESLESLCAAIKDFKALSIARTATHTILGAGNPKADIMLIGEAPGASEDREGIPFCGKEGEMLQKFSHFAGLNPEQDYYSIYSVFWRPPGSRRPTPEECAVCKPLIERYISFIQPKHIICIGTTAASTLLNTKISSTKSRGETLSYHNNWLKKDTPLTLWLHPAHLLQRPKQKALLWQDMLTLKASLS